MKKLIFFIITLLLLSACAATKEERTAGIESRKENNLSEQEGIKKAVESRRYIIKLNRLYFSHGGRADLIPRANYIIIDGEKAIISAGYLGRQYDIRPIEAINIKGKTRNYELKNQTKNGSYEIKMQVSNGINTFDVYLRIGKSGFCSASVSSLKIDYLRYSGQIVPIRDRANSSASNDNMI
jgi:hypothetical protein